MEYNRDVYVCINKWKLEKAWLRNAKINQFSANESGIENDIDKKICQEI